MMDQPIVALDIGTSKVSVVTAFETESGALAIDDVISVPNKGVQRGTILDLTTTAVALQDALRGAPAREVVVNINGDHLEGLNSQGVLPIYPHNRAIHSEDVLHVVNHSRQVMPSPDREQIMALPREFRIDGQRGIKRPLGMSGNRLEVVTHIVTGRIAQILNVEKAVDLSGHVVNQMVATPIAAGLALMTPEEREAGGVVVDLGAGTTSVCVFSGGAPCWTSVIPIGGSHITNDIAKLLKMTPEEAEQLKVLHARALVGKVKEETTVEVRQIGQSQTRHLNRRVLYEIVESRAREIANLVRKHIERSGLFGMLPSGVVLTGGGSHMPGIAQLFAQILSEPNIRVAGPSVEGRARVRAESAEFSTVVGLAKYALESRDSAIEPASGFENWKERIFSLFQLKVV